VPVCGVRGLFVTSAILVTLYGQPYLTVDNRETSWSGRWRWVRRRQPNAGHPRPLDLWSPHRRVVAV
jgi:hypothetical protein